MTIYADQPNSYWTIETPFDEYEDEAYFYEAEPVIIDMPYAGYQDVMRQQRMVLILAMVVIGVFLFAALALPRTQAAAKGGVTAVTQSTVAQTNTAVNIPASGAIAPLFTPEVQYWAPKIGEWSQLYGIDPNIIATIMQIESCGSPTAGSSAGAQGLFQVMPFHFAPGEDMHDPDTNAMRGMKFFNAQMDYTGGNILLSMAGYNGGYAASGGAYETWPNETKRYYKWAKGIYEDAAAGRSSSATLEEWLAAGGAGGCQIAASQLGLK